MIGNQFKKNAGVLAWTANLGPLRPSPRPGSEAAKRLAEESKKQQNTPQPQ